MQKKNDTSSPIGQLISEHLAKFFSVHNGSIPPGDLYQHIMDEVEKPLFNETLKAVDGNQSKAAEVLGINRNTLRKRLNALGIEITKASK